MFTIVSMIKTRFAFVCALGTLVPAVAFAAEDETQMSGAACMSTVPATGDASLTRVHAVYTRSSPVQVVCPIARNVIASDSLEYASMVVYQQAIPNCTLYTYTAGGGLFQGYQPTSQTTAGLPQGMVRLVWGAGDANIATSPGGAYNFLCEMPANSAIYAYYINENDDED